MIDSTNNTTDIASANADCISDSEMVNVADLTTYPSRYAFRTVSTLNATAKYNHGYLCKYGTVEGESTTQQIEPCTLATDIPTHVYIAGTVKVGTDSIAKAAFSVLGGHYIENVQTAGAITLGVPVFLAADGKVQALPATAGTYYQVGVALEAASAAGTDIKIMSCVPVKVTVSE